MFHTQQLLTSSHLPHHHPSPLTSPSATFLLYKPTLTRHSLSSHHLNYLLITTKLVPPCLAQVSPPDPTTAPPQEEEGPIELPPSTTPSSIFSTSDDPTTLQVSTSVLLTGAISVFLFRSLRRRAKRAKELKFRSSGAKKTVKEEAIESLKSMTPTPIDAKGPPSPIQALLGGLSAGVIALILYKFTSTIEAALNRQPLSDNFSVRQITITIRTIVNGLCYLATFLFGINAVGLVLYSGQLAINSFMGDSTSKEGENEEDETRVTSPNPMPTNSSETNGGSEDQSSDQPQ